MPADTPLTPEAAAVVAAFDAVGVQFDVPVGLPGRAKQRVLNAYPRAYAARDVDGFWHIWCPTVRGALSGGQRVTRSAAIAWKLASEYVEAPSNEN